MKRIIQITLFVIFVIAVSGLMSFIYIGQLNQPLNKVIINISRHSENGFLTEALVRDMIPDADSLAGRKVKEIDIDDIENPISKNPFVKYSDAYVNIDKNLIINIQEKHPILRIYNRHNKGFYIDGEGNIFPLSRHYTARVLIANGYIDVDFQSGKVSIFDSIYNKTPLPDLFALTQMIRKNKFLNAQISQLYVNSKGEFDLIPEMGRHLIQFGTMENASRKLENLEIFYKQALLNEGWEKYKTINLKYKNQVVCEKK